jgi:hypothetical protein
MCAWAVLLLARFLERGCSAWPPRLALVGTERDGEGSGMVQGRERLQFLDGLDFA